MAGKEEKGNKTFRNIISIIIALVIIVAFAAVLVIKNGAERAVRNGNIVSFSFSKGNGWSGFSDYVLTEQDNLAFFTAKCVGCPDSFDITKTVDGEVFEELANIIKKYEVAKWDGFDQSDDGAVDGDGFLLKVIYDNEKKIEAHGYMKFPISYREASQEFENILEKIRKE